MARRPVLGPNSLNPLGGGGFSFEPFNVLDIGHEAYIAFLRVETAWNAGRASNDDYLAALDKYAHALPANSSDRISAEARLAQTRYQVERSVLVERVNVGSASLDDLLTYDKGKLEGLSHDSTEYVDRLNRYRSTQNEWIGKQEDDVVARYGQGKMTTAQLVSWYKDALGNSKLQGNPDLADSISKRITELTGRLQDERDSQMQSDFTSGKVSTHDYLAYAIAAKARYEPGTTQAKDWTDRINGARDQAAETDLLYRYGLSQQYAGLEQFVKSNSGKSPGGTSTSRSMRTILGSDGQWHTVTSETTKATAPTKGEQDAYAKLQVQIADAKKQMAEIGHKIAGFPGDWATTDEVLKFYGGQLGKLAKGSADWYRIQEKIDGLHDRAHAETVLGGQGIKITYPGVGGGGSSSGPSAASASSGGAKNVSLADFMHAIARQESGGRYDARNGSTGAYGKYQILPSNWASWAAKAGLPRGAQPTPANQEKVALAAFGRLWDKYHDWSRVAAAWHAGVAGTAGGPGTGNWGPKTTHYVNNIMAMIGHSTTSSSRPVAYNSMIPGSHISQSFWSGHDGVDIAAKRGSPIYAVADGVVSYAQDAGRDGNAGAHWAIGGGNVLNIDIGGNQTTQYAHLDRFAVASGQQVKKGQLIGYVGQTGDATGPHLHFGLWDHSTNKMIDPGQYLDYNGGGAQLARIPGGARIVEHSRGTAPANSAAGYAANRVAHQAAATSKVAPVPTTRSGSVAGGGDTSNNRGMPQLYQETGVKRAAKTGAEVFQLEPIGFPKNMDSAAFEKFYTGYERAFKSGEETWVDTSSGHAIAYFIGTEAEFRIEKMRELDDLRIRMFGERQKAYAGTPTEITASSQAHGAFVDAAQHEYQILDTVSKSTTAPSQSTNPIAAGIRLLDKQKAGIQSEIALAQQAFANGDLTNAYGHLQIAQRYTLPIGSGASLEGYGGAGQQALAAIQKAFGGVTPEEALGPEAAKALRAELDRLGTWDAELQDVLDAGDAKTSGTGLLAQIVAATKKNADGSPAFDDPGPKGKLVLNDGQYWEVKANGSIELKQALDHGYDNSGRPKREPPDMIHTQVIRGGNTLDAYAAYVVDQVGWFVTPGGDRKPLMGKVVSIPNADGKVIQWVENPLHPGLWSNTPIVFHAPASFRAVPDPKNVGAWTYTFQTGGAPGTQGRNGGDGITYSLVLDPKTGVYQVVANRQGLFPIQDQLVGTGDDGDVGNLLGAFTRDTSGVGVDDFTDTDGPKVGWAGKRSYDDWRNTFQPPDLLDQARKTAADAVAASRRSSLPESTAFKQEAQQRATADQVAAGRRSASDAARADAQHKITADQVAASRRAALPPDRAKQEAQHKAAADQVAASRRRAITPPPKVAPTTARTDSGKKKATTSNRRPLPPLPPLPKSTAPTPSYNPSRAR